MKILLATYSAESHTSYGKVTRELWMQLQRLYPEWKIMQHGWFHKSMEKVPWLVEPTSMVRDERGRMVGHKDDIHGRLSFPEVVKKYRPDVVWTLSDPFMCDYMGQYKPYYGYKLIKHCPVDGTPQPPSWKDALKDCDLFVSVTKYGSRALEKWFGFTPPFIYHGVDTNRFVPVGKDDPSRQESRKNLGLKPDTFLFGFVGHNQWRKQNWNMVPLIAYLRSGEYLKCNACERVTIAPRDDIAGSYGVLGNHCRHCGIGGSAVVHGEPRDVRLWSHGFDRKPPEVPWSLERQAEHWAVSDGLVFTRGVGHDSGISENEMPSLYQAMDGYLALSGGEGFCLPIVEAASCGVPSLYTNYSGHAEIGAECGGVPIRCAAHIPEMHMVNGITHRAIVDMESAVRGALELMDDHESYDRRRAHGLMAAREKFSLDIVGPQWGEMIANSCSARKYKTVGVSV